MTDPLPCPFCGSADLWLHMAGCGDAQHAQVMCNACDATGPSVYTKKVARDEEKAMQKATDEWNRRQQLFVIGYATKEHGNPFLIDSAANTVQLADGRSNCERQ